MSTSNIQSNQTVIKSSKSNEDFLLDALNRKALAQLLLDSIDPLVSQLIISIKPVVVDYVRSNRKSLLNGLELLSVYKASKITKIPVRTIYNWIANGSIEVYIADNKNLVSLSQVKFVNDRKIKFKTSQSSLSTQSTPAITSDSKVS